MYNGVTRESCEFAGIPTFRILFIRTEEVDRAIWGLFPPSPVVAQALGLRTPTAERVLLETVRIFERDFLPFQNPGCNVAVTTGEVSGRRQFQTKNYLRVSNVSRNTRIESSLLKAFKSTALYEHNSSAQLT